MANTFCNNLKRLRISKKYTQDQVTESLGVSAQTISRWECGNTLPDVLLLPEIARLYCVTVDDLYKEQSIAYDNYAQRLASVYEATRDPDDFLRSDKEFKKLIRSGSYSAEDMRLYGILHHFMMNYCMDKAISIFDEILQSRSDPSETVYWRTKHQKMLLLSQTGKGKEAIHAQLSVLESNPKIVQEWACIIAAYLYNDDIASAYEWFRKAIEKFPDDGTLYVYGGDICKGLKKYDEAFRYWNKALQCDPNCYDAQYSIGFCYEELGEFSKAYDTWCKIAESLEKDGYDVEAAFPKKLAQKCIP